MRLLLSPEQYEQFCIADPVFYDAPDRLEDTDTWLEASHRPAPAGWQKRVDGLWVQLTPPDTELPVQGWKVHVSVTPRDAERVVAMVWEHCVRAGLHFKFLRSTSALRLLNAKHAPRASSGKAITLYLADPSALAATLRSLGAQLRGIPGPYVLSDLRHGSGPLFVRYGAFRDMWCVNGTGEPVPAIMTPAGELVPDRRAPTFSLPDFVDLPDVLVPDMKSRASGSGGELPYDIERPLHFTNAGGVYLARSRQDGTQVVIREARPHAAVDGTGADAVERLRHEREMLKRLDGIDSVPRFIDYHIVWEHHFLVEEYVPGETLIQAIVRRHPLVHPSPSEADRDAYVRWVDDVTGRVQDALGAVHARGVRFGDLHPANVILRPDGGVSLVDWELAGDLKEPSLGGVGAPGFAAREDADGRDADLHALAHLHLMALIPLVPLVALDESKRNTLREVARKELSVVPARGQRGAPSSPGSCDGSADRAGAMFGADRLDWSSIRESLVAGIHAAATPGRADRLFPGDPLQFGSGGADLAFGAGGVLLALAAVGEEVPDAFVDWLDRAAESPAAARGTGLYDGLHGIAFVLDRLGRRDRAVELLGRAGDGRGVTAPGLSRGRAGIALNLLHFGRVIGDSEMCAAAVDLADGLARDLAALGDAPYAPGLFGGATGSALLCLHLYEEEADREYLELARAALRQDLGQCVLLASGSLYVRDGTRHLPYLDRGTAGIAMVLRQYLRRQPDEELASLLRAIETACSASLVLHPGLCQGRAGLIAALAGATDDETRAVRDAQIRRLGWHAVLHRGHLAFPGHRLRRLSTDLATGTAGVLLALHHVMAAEGEFLPYLNLTNATTDHEGGETCLTS